MTDGMGHFGRADRDMSGACGSAVWWAVEMGVSLGLNEFLGWRTRGGETEPRWSEGGEHLEDRLVVKLSKCVMSLAPRGELSYTPVN